MTDTKNKTAPKLGAIIILLLIALIAAAYFNRSIVPENVKVPD